MGTDGTLGRHEAPVGEYRNTSVPEKPAETYRTLRRRLVDTEDERGIDPDLKERMLSKVTLTEPELGKGSWLAKENAWDDKLAADRLAALLPPPRRSLPVRSAQVLLSSWLGIMIVLTIDLIIVAGTGVGRVTGNEWGIDALLLCFGVLMQATGKGKKR